MLTYVQGSLFDSPVHVLVNAVNTMGVMGRGVAKQFRDIYPDMYATYRRACARKELVVGGLMLHHTPHKTILNFPTKQHWLYSSKVEYIEAGLQTFVASYERYSLMSVAFPQLGCGTGGLDWDAEVRPLMERYLNPLPIDAFVHIHDGGPPGNRRAVSAVKSRLSAEPLPVPFAKVWAGLLAAVDGGFPGGEVTASGWSAERGRRDEETVVCFRRGDETAELDREALFDLWVQLRARGYLAPADLPDGLADAAEPLFALLCRQPWMDRAVLALDQRNLGLVASQGIMYVAPTRPPSPETQAGLFREPEVAGWAASQTPLRSSAS